MSYKQLVSRQAVLFFYVITIQRRKDHEYSTKTTLATRLHESCTYVYDHDADHCYLLAVARTDG